MSAELVFSLASMAALTGWLVLILGVVWKSRFLIEVLAARVWPLGLAVLYSALILFFFRSAPGGFDTLAHVQALFTAPWAALAGWVHYLAFDLFIGAWIAQRVMAQGLSRWWLAGLLPATFLFGPIGLLAHVVVSALFQTSNPEGRT